MARVMLEQVGKYEVIEEIGHGGMATVYRARDSRLGREVALKVLHPHLRGTDEARARFEREAIAVARLRHPCILEIYDYAGEEADEAYIATELLTGPTLRRFVDEHPRIPAELAACIVIRIARALEAAHGQGIIHRDVKPENIMFHCGEVKLTDFGIAQLVDAQGMTTTGQVLGSPGHMAPEQIEGKECDQATDQFSLGTVLYLLATGELPFSGRNPHAVLKQIMEGRYRDPMELRGCIGGRLRSIIRRCLEVDPTRRFPSAAALAEELTAFVAEVGVDDPATTLRDYLADPDAFAATFSGGLVERLTVLGERAQQARAVPQAMDYFNRVLALDDGNERVLSAVQRLGQRSRVRRVVVLGAGAVAVLGGLALWLGLPGGSSHLGRPSVAGSPVVRVAPLEVQVAAASQREEPPPTAGDAEGAAVVPGDGPDGGVAAAPPTTAAAPTQTAGVAGAVKAAVRRPARRPSRGGGAGGRAGGGNAPRVVRFEPVPANVAIGIDGGPAREFGPSFRSIELPPGEHTFSFAGAHDCCVDVEVTERIPAGPGVTVLRQRLQFKPAGLYVAADRAANVSVDGGDVAGRARSIIQVPHSRALTESHRVRVSAKGYRDHVEEVQLQAGQVRTVSVELTPIAVVGGPPG